MIISHKYKFIYFKVQKTAGTSVEIFFNDICDDKDVLTPLHPKEGYIHEPRNYQEGRFYNHVSPSIVKARIGDKIFNSYYKFMNCRNPWSRVVSWYKHGIRSAQELQRGFNHDFESFCGTSLSFSELRMGALIPQADWAEHMDGFIKFENLQEDLFKMCEHLQIPHVSKTIPRTKISDKKSLTSYKDYYTPRSRDLIAKKFAKDIKYFGYEFGD